MIGIYKKTIVYSFLTSMGALIVATLINKDTREVELIKDIFIGVFSSSILIVLTSVIGYLTEEEKLIREYLWKISELKYCSIELQTIPEYGHSDVELYEMYYDKYKQMNQILTNYFAIVDVDFFFHRRKKTQIILELQYKLRPLVKITNKAVESLRVYINGKCNENGERYYTKELFLRDIGDVAAKINNFEGADKSLTLWIIEKEAEALEIINGKNRAKVDVK